jgi:WD40 repeat protein/predicted Ser/Thr protein kinase
LAFGDPLKEPGFDPQQVSRDFRRFGQYELIEEIGRGGMGVVYKARQVSLDRLVAIKMVLHGPFSTEEFIQRFKLEAQASAALRHPNIVSIYEVGQEDGQHYFSMEYIEGSSLAEMAREKPLRARQAAMLVKTLSVAMQYAHEKGVLHRDLKPSNVLVDSSSEPRILDFGLAKLLQTDSELTLSGQALGSPPYMAPEQACGRRTQAGPPTDVYSLGAILYYLITSRPPFQAETLQEILSQVQSAEPVPPGRLNPSLPVDLQTICLKCMHKDPTHRYPSAQALANDLDRFLTNKPIIARPVSLLEQLTLWCQRHPVPTLLSGLLLAAICFGVLGILWEWRQAATYARGESRQRQLAEVSAAKTRTHLYAADISLSAQALNRGEYGLARRTLSALRPQTGQIDLRGFEWSYLWNLCRGTELAVLTGHTWIVTSMAFSPDGRWLASGAQDGTARIWDTGGHRLVHTLNATEGAVWSIAFTPDGKLLMTAGNLGGVKFWDTNRWLEAATFNGQLAALSSTVSIAAISESSPLYWEAAGTVSLWDYRENRKLQEFAQPARAVALAPNDAVVAGAGAASGVYVWDAHSGALLRSLPTDKPVWSLAFSPGGDRLLTAGWSPDLLIWDLRGINPPVHLQGHLRTVWSGAFTPDGSSIVSVGSDQTIRFWDSSKLTLNSLLRGHENEVWCLAISPDGKQLATGGKDQTVRLWPTRPTPPSPDLQNDNANRPLFSPDGKQLLTLSTTNGKERREIWDLASGSRVAFYEYSTRTGFSPDGKGLLQFNATDGALERVNSNGAQSGIVKLEAFPTGIGSFERSGFAPDYRWFFGIDSGGIIRVWNSDDGKQVCSVRGPTPPIRTAILSSKAAYLAVSVERENIVHLYPIRSGADLKLQGHRDFVSGLAFSPDATVLASGSVDGTIRLWDTGSGKLSAQLPGHLEETTDLAFSPDGRTLASLAHGDALKLWHLATLRELMSIEFPEAGYFLHFSPDGSRLACTTSHNSVRILEAPMPQAEELSAAE